MIDKSLETWLIGIFGITGLVVTVLAWVWPAMESDRVVATLAGLTGLLIALFRYRVLKKAGDGDMEKVRVTVKTGKKL
jgi:Flp pilus assembly protein TadB